MNFLYIFYTFPLYNFFGSQCRNIFRAYVRYFFDLIIPRESAYLS